MEAVEFADGRNIAIKAPPLHYENMVRFYKDVLGLKPLDDRLHTLGFASGSNQRWIERVLKMSRAEIWLEPVIPGVEAAANHLEEAGVVRRDEVEPLPERHEGFRIASPASIIYTVTKPDRY